MGGKLGMPMDRRTFVGGAALVTAGLVLSPNLMLRPGEAFGEEVLTASPLEAGSDDILLGVFFSSDNDMSDTLYTSLDGVSFEKIGVAYQDATPDDPDPSATIGGGCQGNPSIIFKNGMFWMCSCHTTPQGDNRFELTFGASNNLLEWSKLGGAQASVEGGWPDVGAQNAVAADWMVDDDGTVYVVACLGIMGEMNGMDYTADRMFPYLIKVERFDITDESMAYGSNLSDTYTTWFANIELGSARRINLPSHGWEGEDDRIDASLYKEDGIYYLCIKRNGVTNEIWRNATMSTDGWTLVNGDVVTGSEGPSLVKWQGSYYCYTDKLSGWWGEEARGTYWCTANDLASSWSGAQRILTTPISMQTQTRHGTVLRVTDAAAQQIVRARRKEAGYLDPIYLHGASNFDETAAVESAAAFPGGADTVIVAGELGWADALSASGLAGALDCPILVTYKDSLSTATRDEIKRLGARQAVIVGGTSVVSAKVEAELSAVTGNPATRCAGRTALETCHSIYCYGANKQYMILPGTKDDLSEATYGQGNVLGRNVWGTDLGIVATSVSFMDALSASPLAFKLKTPLFLADFVALRSSNNKLTDELLADMKESGVASVLICGGTGVIPDSTLDQMKSQLPSATYVRKGGNDEFDTSAQLAEYAVSEWGMSYDGAAFATAAEASGGTDALAGAAVCGKANSVLLLAGDATLNAFGKQEGLSTVRFFGGFAVVSRDFRRRAIGAHAIFGL